MNDEIESGGIQDLSQNNNNKKKKLLNSFIFGIEIVYKDVEHGTFVTIQSITIIYSTKRNGI